MILLASQSPRRQELLKQIGVTFALINVSIDETSFPHEDPVTYVERMAYQKAIAAKMQYPSSHPIILTADTTVEKNLHILGKPQDYADFSGMMRLLSGTTHRVLSSIALQAHDQIILKTCESFVTFAELPSSFIAAYWQTKEPCDKAGGYAVQGLMAQYIKKIEGSYSGIMGLPLFELSQALREIGYNSESFISIDP